MTQWCFQLIDISEFHYAEIVAYTTVCLTKIYFREIWFCFSHIFYPCSFYIYDEKLWSISLLGILGKEYNTARIYPHVFFKYVLIKILGIVTQLMHGTRACDEENVNVNTSMILEIPVFIFNDCCCWSLWYWICKLFLWFSTVKISTSTVWTNQWFYQMKEFDSCVRISFHRAWLPAHLCFFVVHQEFYCQREVK